MAFLSKYRVALSAVGIIFIALLVLAFNRKTEIPIRAETAYSGTMMSTISTNGKIEPVENFEAHAPAAASVKRVAVKQGDHVRKGQLLVQLDDADARAQAAKALAQLRAAEADLAATRTGGTHEEVLTTEASLAKAKSALQDAQRNLVATQKLQTTGAASVEEVQAAKEKLSRAQSDYDLLKQKQTGRYSTPEVARVQAQAEEARAAYNAAQETLRNTDIVSPLDGTVYSLPVRQGSFVSAGDLIVQVAKLQQMQVRAFVDEPEIGKLKIGDSAEVTWDAMPNRKWTATVTSVPTTVIPRGTRSVGEVICALTNGDQKLLPNVNVNVTIVTAEKSDAIVVSREAVMLDSGKRFVYRIENGKLKRTEVTTGMSNLTKIQISSGLEAGARVADSTMNGSPMADGDPVKIIEERK